MPDTQSYSLNECQNWLTDALYYGTVYADSRWPNCKGGVSQVAVAPTPYSPPPVTTGASGSAPAPVSVPSSGCTACGKSGGPLAQPVGPTGQPLPMTTKNTPPSRFPWWVFVLAGLTLAQLVKSHG